MNLGYHSILEKAFDTTLDQSIINFLSYFFIALPKLSIIFMIFVIFGKIFENTNSSNLSSEPSTI